MSHVILSLDTIRKLKYAEKIPASKIEKRGEWSYKQYGGKDPKIKLFFAEQGWHKLTVLVRPDSVYFSHSATVDLQTMEEALVLIRDSTHRLNQKSEA